MYKVMIDPPDHIDYVCVFEGTLDECEAYLEDCLADDSYPESDIWIQSWNGEVI